jgi:hypothetical protein
MFFDMNLYQSIATSGNCAWGTYSHRHARLWVCPEQVWLSGLVHVFFVLFFTSSLILYVCSLFGYCFRGFFRFISDCPACVCLWISGWVWKRKTVTKNNDFSSFLCDRTQRFWTLSNVYCLHRGKEGNIDNELNKLSSSLLEWEGCTKHYLKYPVRYPDSYSSVRQIHVPC